MTKTATIGALLALLATTPAAAQQVVKSFLGQSARIFDQDGNPTGEVSITEFKTPAAVFDHDKKGHPAVKAINGKTYYLKPADVLLEGGDAQCKTLVIAQKSPATNQHLSEIGVSAGASEHAVPCVPASDK